MRSAPDRRTAPPVRAIDLGGRTPPHNDEAEAAVLSAMLCDERAVDAVRAIIGPEHFYRVPNQRICEAAYALHDANRPVDVQTVAGWLRDRDELQRIGGLGYINKLVDATPAVVHVAAHAKIVRGKARRRQLIETCQTIAAEGYGDVGDEDQWIADSSEAVSRVAAVAAERRVRSMRDLVAEEEHRLARIASGEIAAGGLEVGYRRIDDATAGIVDGEIIVVGAKPGIGKTAFAGSVAVNVASSTYEVKLEDGTFARERAGVLIFSLEMPDAQLLRRMAGAAAEINTKRLRVGKLSGAERDRLTHGHARLEPLPIFIDDSPTHTPASMRAVIRREQTRFDRPGVQRLRLVIIDYLTLITPDRVERGMTREQEVGQVAQALRAIARQCRLPLMELVQLKKSAADGADVMPELSDIRDSGQIEACANGVWFLHRPEHYIADKKQLELDDEQRIAEGETPLRGLGFVRMAKTRDGSTPLVQLRYTDWCTRFDNFEAPRRVEQTDEPTQQALIA